MPDTPLAKLVTQLEEHAKHLPEGDVLKLVAEVEVATAKDFIKDRQLNAKTRRKLLRIMYTIAAITLGLGGVSVLQQFQNADRVEDIQANRVQITYDSCASQNKRFDRALATIDRVFDKAEARARVLKAGEDLEKVAKDLDRAPDELASLIGNEPFGANDTSLDEISRSKANLQGTLDLIADLVLDEPLIRDPRPRRDCEQLIVDRYGPDAHLADVTPAARKRIDKLLR